jgi:hypothetical protein
MAVVWQDIFVGETDVISFDFSSSKPTGSSLASATLAAEYVEDGKEVKDVSSTFLSNTTASISSDTASGVYQNVKAGRKVKVTCTATFDNSPASKQVGHLYFNAREA